MQTLRAVYLCLPPEIYGLDQACDQKTETHFISKENNVLFLWSAEFSAGAISPRSFNHLKDKFFISEITIFDRIKGINENVSIKDHINRSGLNFLSSKTPFKNRPMFPDMSKIYHPIKGLRTVIVHTVGPEKFQKTTINNVIISEAVALIAPVWHYIGVRVSAKGISYVEKRKRNRE
jgi:hypothetical protein|tara:strand:+ start:505 stop:1035 length:531 start_codon:yes stop_codon:yes gene_type:complete